MKADGGRRLVIALALVAVWAAITLLGGLAQAGQGSLGDLVSRQISWATPTAALFLLVSAWLLGWRDLGLNGPRPARSISHLWLFAVYIVGLGTLAALSKDIPQQVLIVIAINTFFVGFSEELAFRGVLWGAARKVMPFWLGVMFVSAIFGSIHLLNTFITGELGAAAIQAFNAFLSGIALLALRIRMRSIVPVFIAHWLWDFVIFVNGYHASAAAPTGAAMNPLMGIALVGPLALYGLWIIRKREFHHLTDDLPEDSQPRRSASV